MDIDPCRLYLGTGDGVRVALFTETGVTMTASGVEGNAVRAFAVNPDDPDDAFVGCGLRGWGLYRTTDGGETFDELGFGDEWVWGLARHPDDPETLYVGTEPPRLHVSRDGGETFDACEALDDLPSREEWTFFHEPFFAGHVHGIAVHPDRPERILAGVEHGALVRSLDGGATWTERLVGADVHRVAVHPTDPDRVYAAVGEGLYRSTDGGDTWSATDDLDGRYCHAVELDPTDPERMYAYATEEGSPLFRSEDGGETWAPLGGDLPAARAADTVRLHPADPGTLVYAGEVDDEESRLFVSDDRGRSWTRLDTRLPKVWRVEAVPVPR